MDLPKITDTALGYVFEWKDEMITIDVTRLKQGNDGRLVGEISITTTAPGYNSHLHQASFNFTSSSTREKLAKQLKSSFECEWHVILEQLCVYTLRKHRSGTPVETIWTNAEITPPSYLINPLVIKNYPTIFFGDPSSGKSALSQLIITTLTLPWYDNNIGLSVNMDPNECIIFDYETDRDTVGWQIGCIQRGMGLPEFGFHYRRCYLPLADDLEESMKAIEETKAKVIIVDSIGPACGGELNEARPALAMMGALRKLNRTSILLAHNSKNTEGKKTIYGSIFFNALARSVWEVKKVQETGNDDIDIGLFHRKPPPFSKLQKPIGFKFSFNGDKTMVKPESPKSIGEFLQQMGTQDRIEEMLRSGAMKVKDIAESLDITEANTRQALKRLSDKNKVTKVGEKYGLLHAQ
jgi:archaellum biogenesis ATPase FlaH